MGNYFLYVYVVIYLCINLKPLKKNICNSHTKICNSINNNTHYEKNSGVRTLNMVIFV